MHLRRLGQCPGAQAPPPHTAHCKATLPHWHSGRRFHPVPGTAQVLSGFIPLILGVDSTIFFKNVVPFILEQTKQEGGP